MLKRYGLLGICQLILFKIRTKLIFPNARLIRFPFRVRGKKYIQIDDNFTTGFNCRIDAFSSDNTSKILMKIGKNVQINDDVHIAAMEHVEIGDDVLIASKVYISDHNHGSYKGEVQDSPLTTPNSRKIYTSPVKIEKNVWLGEFVCVLQGITIGEGSIIGAMSVVSKDIPPYSIAVGSPAKVIKTYDFNLNQWININKS
ncbi:LbetaH domain-containing protein [Elizabethkingia miricola]|uniref:acetyltransferase n=1 Tax=Elizabethkingia miricola TaxID=172045 RepID=UPI00389162EE